MRTRYVPNMLGLGRSWVCQGREKDPAERTVIKGREVESGKERGMEGKAVPWRIGSWRVRRWKYCQWKYSGLAWRGGIGCGEKRQRRQSDSYEQQRWSPEEIYRGPEQAGVDESSDQWTMCLWVAEERQWMRGKKTDNSSDIVCRDKLGSHYLCEIIFLWEWQEGSHRERKSQSTKSCHSGTLNIYSSTLWYAYTNVCTGNLCFKSLEWGA